MALAELKLVSSRTAAEAAAPARPRKRIGEILCDRGLIDAEQVRYSLERQSRMDARLGDLLRFDAGLSEADMLSALEDQWQSHRIDLDESPPDIALVNQAGLADCLKTLTLPWRRIGGATVIAAVRPDQFEAMRAAYEERYGPIMLALVGERALINSLEKLFPHALTQQAENGLSMDASCRNWRGDRFQTISLAVLATIALLMLASPLLTTVALSLLVMGLITTMGVLKGSAALALLRRPADGVADNIRPLHPTTGPRLPVVSLLVPLYHEQQIATHLIKRLQRLKYPSALLDVCLVTEDSDTVTARTLERTCLPDWMRVIRTPPGTLKTKPRALNYALNFVRGSIVGVYDAEDAPDADQIATVVAHFATCAPDVGCLQGRLSFYNPRQNWLSRCFAIEYATWFGVVLPGISRLNLALPLGGTTIFFRTALLRELGGWDAYNVTEDADLGLRLARRGYRTELIDTVTEEEANCRAIPWVRQRSRWIKGYAMTYATHMQDPRGLWDQLGPRAFVGFQVMFLGTLLQALLAPVAWTWWLLFFELPHPLLGALPTPVIVAIGTVLMASEALSIALSAIALKRTRQKKLMIWAFSMNIYHMLATFAAYKALIELTYKPFFWDKTRHGLSLPLTVETAPR